MLLFNCFFFCLFGLPHIFSADGNLTEMGWAWQTKFMPMKSRSVAYPVTEEMQLLVTHLAAIVGGVQTTMAVCCLLFATLSTDKNAKKLVIGACLYAHPTSDPPAQPPPAPPPFALPPSAPMQLCAPRPPTLSHPAPPSPASQVLLRLARGHPVLQALGYRC